MELSTEYARWCVSFENITISSLAFYEAIVEELKARQIPDVKTSQITFREKGLTSPKRIYLKVNRDWLTYRICAAPFGTGFFLSSRLLFWPWNSWPVLMWKGLALLAFDIIVVNTIGKFLHSPSANQVIGLTVCLTFVAYAIIVVSWINSCRRLTYYRQDTMEAFQEAIHNILVACVNKVIQADGRQPLSDQETKPVMHKLLQRAV